MTKKESVLQEAERIINGPRADAYGHPYDDFTRTGKMWEQILGIKVDALQVARCMIALKISRDVNKPGRDNLVDIAGYAGCAEKIVDHTKSSDMPARLPGRVRASKKQKE